MTHSSAHIRIPETTSTNEYLARWMHQQEVPEFTIVSAEQQSRGKGHQNARWESEPGKNLTLSTVWYPSQIKPNQQFRISIAVSLAVYDTIASFVSGASVKWPNDLYIGEKKAAGILIEHTLRGACLDHSIIGIGININQETFPSWLPNPVSLRQVTGQNFILSEIVDRLSAQLRFRYQQMYLHPIRQKRTYLSLLYRYHKWVLFEDQEGRFEGCITGINSVGWLEITLRNGQKKYFAHKEIQFLPSA